jgi:hypothetical protein
MAVAIQKEVWVADIAANLFPDNTFMARSVNDDQYVDNKVVNRPNAGAKPGTSRNRSSFPATIVQRTDTNGDYNIHEFTSDPTLIRDIEETEVNYNKRQNVLSEHINTLNEDIANFLLSVWCPTNALAAAQILAHTGVATRTTAAPGGTGTRKVLTKEDIRRAVRILNAQEMPQGGRYCILDAQQYDDLLADPLLLSREYMDTPNLATGSVGKIFGVELYVRSSVGRMATGNTLAKDPKAANAATDNAFGLVWHESMVARALGEIKVFADEDKPEYYGSIFSSLARAGGATYYRNQRGVIALVEVV